MAEHSGPQAYWRTKKAIRRRPVGSAQEQNASPTNDASPHEDLPNGQQSRKESSTQAIDDLAIDPRETLMIELQKPLDTTGSQDFPQADGFLGLYLYILLWRSACFGTAYTEHVSPYSGRIGHYRNETVKLGEGASFTVSKRHDVGPLLGRASRVIVMKNSKIKFEEDGTVNDHDGYRSLIIEIKILTLKAIRMHQNIVKLLDIRWDHPSLESESLGPTLYLEYAQLGTLADFRLSHHESFLEEKTSRTILLDICRGLEALHQCHITHGDIKPSNILLFQEHDRIVAKISDFGSAIFTQLEQAEKVMLPGLSPPWDAPEAGSQVPTSDVHKSDIYSFGLMYWWYRCDGNDPFGVDSAQTNIFGFKGDRHTRMDALKTLKQSQDLDVWAYKSITKSDLGAKRNTGLLAELKAICSSTLLKSPAKRSLTEVKRILESGLDKSILQTEDMRASDIMPLIWSPGYAWTIPLNSSPFGSEPAHQFLEILKFQSSNTKNNTWQRMTVLILLSRCHFEGYGTSQNFPAAARYLREAAECGDHVAQANTFNINMALQLSSLEPKEAWKNLFTAAFRRDYSAMQDKHLKSKPQAYTDSCAQLSRHDHNSYSYILEKSVELDSLHISSEVELLAELERAKASSLPEGCLALDTCFKGQLLHHSVRRGWNTLCNAFLQSLEPRIRKHLIDKLDDDQLTPLLYACRTGNHKSVLCLLDSGASANISTGDSTLSILNYLPDVRRDPSGNHIALLDITRKLVRAGANPNVQPDNYGKFYGLFTGNLDPMEWDQAVQNRSLPPLVFATWLGDLDAVACLLEAGALPDALCLQLAASLHQTKILEKLLARTNLSRQSLNIGRNTLMDTTLRASTIFPPTVRSFRTKKTPAESMEQMISFLLSERSLLAINHTITGEHTAMNICRYLHEPHPSTIQKLFSILWPEEPSPPQIMETLTSAVIWNNQQVVEHLLSGKYPIDETTKAAVLMRCAEYSASPKIYEKLIESHSFDVSLGHPSKFLTELETPIQVAIACQNFSFASYLFEKGANRDTIVSSPTSRLDDRTFLSWLVKIAWSESSNRLSYLFKSYLRQDPPHFIVLPHVGKSVLQQVASQAPANQWSEKDVRDMMGYLVDMYPGSRHLEYQRIDEQKSGSDTKHAGYVHVIANGVSEVVKNDFHFKNPNKTFTPTKEKEHNGTALHHAVRSVNFPAVEVLIQAGADASAMIGLALPESISVTRKPASTYAVRENLWASTVLDFAVLVNDRLEAGAYPASMPDRNPATVSYFKKRSADIIELLNKRGAAHSVTFVGKRNEERIYSERRTKGNIAAFRMFSKDLKDGVLRAVAVGKAAAKEGYKEAKEEWKDERASRHRSQQVIDNDLAVDYYGMGRLKEAAELYEKALELNEREMGEYDNLTLLIRSNLAMVYNELGDGKKALELGRSAFEGYELAEGDKHKMTFTAASNLGTILVNQGEWKEAQSLYLKALEGRKRLLGPDHPDTLSIVGNLASSYSRQGNYEAADEAFHRALSGQEKALGPEDDKVLSTMYNMALHYSRSGRKQEARDMLSSVLTTREKLLGREHFKTLDTLRLLAGVVYDLEDFEQAISMYERLLPGYSGVLGYSHPSTTTVAFKLGLIYKEKGKLNEACDTLRQAIKGEDIRLGAEHADTLLSVYNLASVYKDQKEYTQAEILYLRVLNAREKENGLDDMLIRNSNYDLGTMYSSVGRLEEAATVLELALKGEEKALGPENNSTLYTAFDLAKVYKRQKRYDEAESMFLRALTGREKSLGLKDSAVRISYFNIGEICQQSGRLEEAASTFESCLKGEEEALRATHSDTIMTVGRLALVYKKLRRYEESARNYLRVLAVNEATSGPESKAFLDTSYNLGLVYKALPNYVAAEGNFLVASNGYEKLLGADNSETLDAMDEVASVLELANKLAEALAMHEKVIERQERKLGADHSETKDTAKKVVAIRQKLNRREPTNATPQPRQVEMARTVTVQQPLLDNETARLINSLSQNLARDQAQVRWDIGHFDRVLNGEISIFATDAQGLTALLWATHHGHTDMATRLVEVNSRLDARDKGGRTALHMASSNGNIALVKLFLEKGASIRIQDARGSNALHHATATNQHEVIRTLLETGSQETEGFDIDAESKDGYTALHVAASNGNAVTARLLMDKGAKLTTMSGRLGGTAAHIAADRGNSEVLQLFIDAGLNLDDYSAIGMTALHYTASKGHKEATQLLLSRGANMETKCPSNDYSALFYSTFNRHEDVSQMLIDHGADMYAQEANGIPLLHYLAYHGIVDGVRLLLENGIDMETKDPAGATAIFAAARCKTVDALQLLLECGADTASQNNLGATALHYAAGSDCTKAIELLTNFGANVNEKDSTGLTPLHVAALEDKEASARLLMEKGADVHAMNSEGQTALQMAAMKKHTAVMSLLILGISS